jgi:hypothetical protein
MRQGGFAERWRKALTGLSMTSELSMPTTAALDWMM